MNHDYVSCFAEYIKGMLDARDALGYAREPHAATLLSFDKYCSMQHPDCVELTEHLVMPWVLKDGNDTKGIKGRASAIRLLAQYMNISGQEAYVLPDRYFGNPKPKETYIFSDSELSSLFSAIDTLPEDKKIPYTRQMLPVLFRLIYTCGRRPQEGRELKRRNINFQTGEILITNTKKKKERFVVMSDDMLMLCRRYDKMRQFFYEDNPYFFPGSSEGPLDGQWLNRQFQKCWQTVNPGVPKEQLPSVRVYSLRHQFATANVNRWLDEQKDLDAMLPRLRAYMGHYTLKETAYYVHLLPENLSKNRGIDWEAFSEIIPEVEPWQE